jgi:RNA polymerase sigma-70 factor (ECF subfamily)
VDHDQDHALVEAAAAGDAVAAETLICRYQTRMFNFARTLTANDSDAEDVAQETFLRAFRGLGQFRGESSFKNWLYRIASNVARSHLGKRVRQGSVWDRRVEADDAAEHAPVDPAETAEDSVIRRDLLDRSLSALSDDLRMALVLHDVEGLEYREIAVVLSVPIGTVMSRIFRARRRLRPLLTDLLQQADRSESTAKVKRPTAKTFGNPTLGKVAL